MSGVHEDRTERDVLAHNRVAYKRPSETRWEWSEWIRLGLGIRGEDKLTFIPPGRNALEHDPC